MSIKVKSSTETGGGSALVPKRRFPEFQEANGWETAPGDKLFQQVNNREAPPGLPILAITQEHGAIPRDMIDYHVSVTEKSLETYKEVRPGDFIISLRSFQGGIEFSEYHGICSPAYVILRKRGDLCDQFYKQHFKSHGFIRQLTKNLEGLRDGKMISYKQFSELQLLQLSLPEQQKVADCLASADALIEAQARKVEALKAHKKGLMQQLFPQEGETQPRLRFPEFEGTGEWEEGTISNIGTVLQGYGFPERYQGQQSGDFPFYKVSDISRSLGAGKTFIEEAANYVNENQLKELRAKPIPTGTTVFAKIGEAIRSNKRAITTVPCLIDNNAAGVKSIKGKATDFFIYLTMEQISLIDHAGGVVPAVNKSAIEAIPVKFPQVAEQQRIADCYTSLGDLIAGETRKLDTLKTHKKGLMQQLFPRVWEADT
jgi:type I restriction enzyme S subunit